MNRLKSIVLTFIFAVMTISCGKEEPVVEYLEVNAHNISGSWSRVDWYGTPLDDATYMYIDFVRKDKTFTMYHNLDSMTLPHIITGRFNIVQDDVSGALIRGDYDYGMGDWDHRYVVMHLTQASMTWVASDDPSKVIKFVRIGTIPEDIKGAE